MRGICACALVAGASAFAPAIGAPRQSAAPALARPQLPLRSGLLSPPGVCGEQPGEAGGGRACARAVRLAARGEPAEGGARNAARAVVSRILSRPRPPARNRPAAAAKCAPRRARAAAKPAALSLSAGMAETLFNLNNVSVLPFWLLMLLLNPDTGVNVCTA